MQNVAQSHTPRTCQQPQHPESGTVCLQPGEPPLEARVEAALPAVTETMKLAEQKKVGEALLVVSTSFETV